ncbi:MAG: FAD-dependent oxidoreductase [Candidatus Melainabacteria bacterium]|nr:MAG: FAD-dependent oxidoreductase [Candidatus Melainabacteria bacterium]
MNQETEHTSSLWSDQVELPKFPTLTEAKTCDVCIVGGGITGFMSAYLLASEGKRVIVVDDGPPGAGETNRTSAHVTDVLDTRYHEIISKHGVEGAKSVFHAFRAGLDQIAGIIRQEKIDCDFEKLDGYLFLSPDSRLSELEQELRAVSEVGFANVQLVDCPLSRKEKTPALCFPNQYRFHVLKFLDGLIDACLDRNVEIYANTHIGGIDDGDRVIVKRTNHENVAVTADAVIIATNSPILGLGINLKQAAYRTYAIAGRVPLGAIPKGLFWDTADPYHYVRTQPIEDDLEYELLIVGGEDHKTGQADDGAERFARLEEWTRTWCGNFRSIDYKWSGQVYEPFDGIGFVGKQPGSRSIYIATGASGVGMSFAGLAGILLTDEICGRENSAAEIFSPGRVPLSSPIETIRENINAAVQFIDYLTKSDVTSVTQIHPGEGAVITRNGQRVAVCRDEHGNLCERSAVCPHMGGIVSWNSLEKSWDCPVHGSRFDMNGKVIDGPANEDLGEPAFHLESGGAESPSFTQKNDSAKKDSEKKAS